MTTPYIPESELIINPDGSVFHLHLKPGQLANKIILVGDPGRVAMVASHFEQVECEAASREFHAITGCYRGKRLTVLSTGIGCDNIDIVMTELDALVNIDFTTRTPKSVHHKLELVRIGTCGGIQPYTPTGSYILSVKSIGFDGLLNFYAGRNEVCDLTFESEFKRQVSWNDSLGNPYVVNADPTLVERIAGNSGEMIRGVTVACGGFYGPQGRSLRIPLADPTLNERIRRFEADGLHITNFEMESSALAGMSLLLGHRAVTVCMVVANRQAGKANASYHSSMDDLIQKVLERL